MAPLRGVAEEILVAADTQTDPSDVEHYRAVADRVLSCNFERLESHLAWLHQQCSSDWILRLDGDEVPSPALIAVLPELIAARDVLQYWLPTRWLDPSGQGWLDELPWAPDYHNRLVRNDENLRFGAELHSGADLVYPARYLQEPFYHLLCALETRDERHVHSLLYEVQRPSLVAPGGGPFNATFYLPERFARRAPKPLPEEDRLAVRPVLEGSDAPSSGLLEAQVAEPVETIAILEPDLRMYEDEARGFFVTVRNDAGETWPGGLHEEPRIRLSYHWRDLEGRVLVHDGERSPLPAPLAPGETAIAPLTVVAPALRGRYLLEVDLVHEDVRWFGEGVLAGVDIVAAGPTERSVPSKCARLLWRPRIPRVLHRIWLGSKPLPDEQQAFGESWRRHHPGWKHRLWTDADLPSLAIPDSALARAEDLSQVSDLVRYHVLAHQGGVYVDTDVECLRSVEPLLRGVSGFASFSLPGIVETGILGAIPGHPAFVRAAELSLLTVGTAPSPSAAGPPFLTHVFWEFPDVTIFPRELFSPYLWNEPERRDERFEGAYAVHHWAMSWRDATPER